MSNEEWITANCFKLVIRQIGSVMGGYPSNQDGLNIFIEEDRSLVCFVLNPAKKQIAHSVISAVSHLFKWYVSGEGRTGSYAFFDVLMMRLAALASAHVV